MQILFDAAKPVKATRTFGRGLTAYRPQHSYEPYTIADLEWLREEEARREAELEAHLAELFAEYRARERLEAGRLP